LPEVPKYFSIAIGNRLIAPEGQHVGRRSYRLEDPLPQRGNMSVISMAGVYLLSSGRPNHLKNLNRGELITRGLLCSFLEIQAINETVRKAVKKKG